MNTNIELEQEIEEQPVESTSQTEEGFPFDKLPPNFVPVQGLKRRFYERWLKSARMVIGYDMRTKKFHVLYDEDLPLTSPDHLLKVSFKSSKHDLRFLCYKVEQIKGSCLMPPKRMLAAYKPKPVSVLKAARKYNRSERQIRRWKEYGDIVLIPGDGNVEAEVDAKQVKKLARAPKGKKRKQNSVLFTENCENRKVSAVKVLDTIFMAGVSSGDRPEVHDVDLVAAAMRLSLEPRSKFLLFLSEQQELDGTFDAEIARLLGPDPNLETTTPELCRTVQPRWRGWQTDLMNGTTPLSGLRDDTFEAVRDMMNGGKPKYLDQLTATEVPDWALRSVLSFRQSKKTKDAESAIHSLAEKNEKLKEFLKTVPQLLKNQTPNSSVPLIDSRILRTASPPKGDQVIEDAIRNVSEHLVTGFGVPTEVAKTYVRGTHTRLHLDKRASQRQVNSGDWKGPAAAKKLKMAVVKRMFGSVG